VTLNASLANPDFFSRQVGGARRFYLDLDPSRRHAVSVVSGGLEHCAPDYTIHRTSFPYCAIEYVIRGRGQLTLGTTDYALKAGVVFAYGPRTAHQIITDPRAPLVKYFIDFAGTRAASILKTCGLAGGLAAQVFPPDSIALLFEEMIESGTAARTDSGALCAKLLECLAFKIGAKATPLKDAESPAFAAYLKCRSLIERDFLRLRSLEQIAQACDMDNAYICRLFRRFDHQSPYQYLLRLKINFAAVELQRPGILIKDLAAMVGFHDSFHFSRVFHNILGSSPAQFRRLR
jgi:AraC-like DNA-binding protein